VRDGSERRGVGGQGDRRKRRALALEAVEQLRGEVLRVGGRAAVAAGENLAPLAQRLREERGGAQDRLGEDLGRRELEVRAFCEVRGYAAAQRRLHLSHREILHPHPYP